MNKKKLVSLCLVLALLLTVAIGGTMAYFTDTEADENVMTIGKVDIVQHEMQRGDDDSIEAFEDNKMLVPVVGTSAWGTPVELEDGKVKASVLDDTKMKNIVDKFIYVENEGNVPVYARTLVAFEDTNDVSQYFMTVGANLVFPYAGNDFLQIKDVNGTVYTVGYITYKDAIAAGGFSPVALSQYYMIAGATQEQIAPAGDSYTILALSQAIQADGFANADAAFQAESTFGAITETDDEKVAEWFNEALNTDTFSAK